MGIFEIKGEPRFERFVLKDVNPISGRVKKRKLSNPNEAMKELHGQVVKTLRSSNHRLRGKYLRYATGATKGNSPLSNVRPHRRNKFFYLMDFANAFMSVEVTRLSMLLKEFEPFSLLQHNNEVEKFAINYLMDPRGGLTLGGNASTDLFNLYVGRYVDTELAQIIETHGLTYTRYIDDLTFSSPKPITAAVRGQIRQVVIAAGFLINHKKCEVVDLEKRTVVITGIGLEYGGRVLVPRHYLRKVRGFIHSARTSEEMRSLEGMVNLIETVSRANSSTNRIEERVLSEYRTLLRSH